MCIIVYKPTGIKMPNKEILTECFDRNPDGAGYMFPEDGKVIIKKGFMNFKALYKSVMKDYTRLGVETPFVLHFRIQTQGGVNQECTHPFALSKNMEELKLLDNECEFGVAHNGIISLTSTTSYGTYYDSKTKKYVYNYKQPDYSDTMKFITDYLALMIHNKEWYKNEDTLALIEKLVGASNKFTIMDGDGHTTLIGNFIEDNGIYYSNSTYKPYYTYYNYNYSSPNYDYPSSNYDYNDYDEYEKYYNSSTGEYDFDEDTCPLWTDGTDELCQYCSHCEECGMCAYKDDDYIDTTERRCD